VYTLSQADFDAGALVFAQPGVYTSSISFDPVGSNSAARLKYWPNCGLTPHATLVDTSQSPYCTAHGQPNPAYRIGFFAAVAMTGAEVRLDLQVRRLSEIWNQVRAGGQHNIVSTHVCRPPSLFARVCM